MLRNIIINELVPRTVFLPYFLAKILLLLIAPFSLRKTDASKEDPSKSVLCIEAGVRGWESLEFKESYQSACEYLGIDNVVRLVIQPDVDYVFQVKQALMATRISHYVYDPRTGNQNWWTGLCQSLMVAIILQRHNVTPIVLLTDLSYRKWRAQSGVVSARKGVVVSFMSARVMHPIFPHRRLLGPCLMPFSHKTKVFLDQMIENRGENVPPRAVFTGSLYEPRISILNEIKAGLEVKGSFFDVSGRVEGGPRTEDAEYWQSLSHADIVVTTAVQRFHDGMDWQIVPHLIYRYLEVLASGSLLVANDVPGVRRYFTPGVHFVSFDASKDAIESISYYLQNDDEREEIARQGKKKADELISSKSFWMLIDSSLGRYGLL